MKLIKTFALLLGIIVYPSYYSFGQADSSYLQNIRSELRKGWPNNRTINIVFHGHSVPSGYYVAPDVRKFGAYPHLSLVKIKDQYPNAVVNSITTSIGGEQAERGETRFANEVLTMRPDVLFIDYALNDRGIGLERAKEAWQKMIDAALAHSFTDRDGNVHKVKLYLMTPTPDTREDILSDQAPLELHSAQIRQLAKDNNVGLVDSYALFKEIAKNEPISNYMSTANHPNERGHQIVANEIAKLFTVEEKVADGLYYIKGNFTQRFMTVSEGSTANNTQIVVQDSSGADHQKFWVKSTPEGYVIQPYHSGRALGIEASSTANGGNLFQIDSTGSANERFTLTFAANDNFWIINKNSAKYIATPGTQNTNGTPVIQWNLFDQPNYQWKFIPAEESDIVIPPSIEDGLYFIKGNTNSKYMTVENKSGENGALLVISDSANISNQKFWIRNTSEGYAITAFHSKKALGIFGESFENNANLVQIDSTGAKNERYGFEQSGDALRIVNKNSTKYISSPSGSSENGTAIVQFDLGSNYNYDWLLIGTSTTSSDDEQVGEILQHQDKSNEIEIFPNPTQDKFNIVFSKNEPLRMRLLSSDGRLIKSYENINGSSKIDLPENLESGIYVIELTSNNDVITKKIIIR